MKTILMKSNTKGRPYAEVIEGAGTEEDPTKVTELSLDMLFALFGVVHDLPIHRAGTITRLVVHKCLEKDGADISLTPLGREVLEAAQGHLANFVASILPEADNA